MKTSKELSDRRRKRTSGKVKKNNDGRPRMAVYRSSKHIYAQIISPAGDTVLASAGTVEKELRSGATGNAGAAAEVGKLIADRAKKAGIEVVAFDRSGFKYHGRVKALAEAARENGLKF